MGFYLSKHKLKFDIQKKNLNIVPPGLLTPHPAVIHRSFPVDGVRSVDKHTGDTDVLNISGFCSFNRTAFPEYKKCLNLACERKKLNHLRVSKVVGDSFKFGYFQFQEYTKLC